MTIHGYICCIRIIAKWNIWLKFISSKPTLENLEKVVKYVQSYS